MNIKQGWLEELAISFAYQLKKNREKPTIPGWASGWEVLCTSQDDEATRSYGYKAVVLVNHSTKVLQIASAGTILKDTDDLWDNIKFYFGWVPNKLAPVKSLVDQVINRLGNQQEALCYQFNCCGHSLGAVVSDLMMAEIVSRDLNFGVSRTYDSPGSKNIVNSAIKQKLLSGCRVPTLEQLAMHAVEYNARPNFINRRQPHLAGKIYLVCPNIPIPAHLSHGSRNSTKIGTWIRKCTTALRRCANYLGLSTIAAQLKAHQLQHLSPSAATEVVEVNGWTLDWPSVKAIVVMEHTEIADLLKHIRSTGGDFVLYDEEIETGGWSVVESYWRSFNDLFQACSAVCKKEVQLGPGRVLQTIGVHGDACRVNRITPPN